MMIKINNKILIINLKRQLLLNLLINLRIILNKKPILCIKEIIKQILIQLI